MLKRYFSEYIQSRFYQHYECNRNRLYTEKKVPIYGYIVNPLDIPNVLFKDQTMIFNLNSKSDHRYRKSLLLSYECGEGLNATFFTDISPFQGMLVSDGYILKREKMNLSFAENHNLSGRFSDHSAVTVNWRLTR